MTAGEESVGTLNLILILCLFYESYKTVCPSFFINVGQNTPQLLPASVICLSLVQLVYWAAIFCNLQQDTAVKLQNKEKCFSFQFYK